MHRTWTGLLALLALAAAVAPGAGAQQQRAAIVGRVTERGTEAPIADANVVIVGTQRGARTDRTGAYRIADVPAGSYTIRVMRLGYGASSRLINVSATDVTADFVLQTSAVEIDQVGDGGRGGGRRAAGTAIHAPEIVRGMRFDHGSRVRAQGGERLASHQGRGGCAVAHERCGTGDQDGPGQQVVGAPHRPWM